MYIEPRRTAATLLCVFVACFWGGTIHLNGPPSAPKHTKEAHVLHFGTEPGAFCGVFCCDFSSLSLDNSGKIAPHLGCHCKIMNCKRLPCFSAIYTRFQCAQVWMEPKSVHSVRRVQDGCMNLAHSSPHLECMSYFPTSVCASLGEFQGMFL